MKLQNILSMAMLCALATAAQAQCNFNPTISGADSVLCAGQTVTFSTQEYDSYQWYRREYLDTVAVPIAGATGQSLAVTDAYIVSYIWVEATDGGCTEASPEVLIDGHAYLPPFVAHTGDYEFDPNTFQFLICKGDTMFLELFIGGNITWFRNDEPIPGETSPYLAITESGAYTASGSPGPCPNLIEFLGVVLDVVVINCTSPTVPEPVAAQVSVYPNPVGDWLTVERRDDEPLRRLELFNAVGQMVQSLVANGGSVQRISMSGLPSGTYTLRVHGETGIAVTKLVKL